MIASLALLALSASAPAVVVADARDADWRRAATPADRARLRGWRSAWMAALADARATGDGAAAIARDGGLFDPDRSLEQPLPPSGDYRCRTVKLGRRGAVGLGYVAYPWFRCWVGERGEFVRLDGSQRQVGRFFADTDARAVFLGTLALGDEHSPIAYARDPQRDLAGLVERIGERRWRIAFPFPAFESKLDVVEVVPD